MKPLFCNKIKSVENITLDGNGKLVRDEKEVTNIFNYFFVNTVPNLEINTEHHFCNSTNISHNRIDENAIYKYQNHPSVTAIKNQIKGTNSSFSFQTIKKESTAKLIPKKLVKEFGCLLSSFIASNVNKCINERI